MCKMVCLDECGNNDQYEGFNDTEHGLFCRSCGQRAYYVETFELERKYSKEYLDAEFKIK